MKNLKLYKKKGEYILSSNELDAKLLASYNDISELYPEFYTSQDAYSPNLFESTSAVSNFYASTPTRTVSDAARASIGAANSVHQSGTGNSQFGTMWIHSEEEKRSKKIRVTDDIPDGWVKGRKIKFD